MVHHRIDGFLDLEDLTANIGRDLLGKIAICDRDGDFGDIPDLTSEVVGHGVDVVGEIFPRACNARHLCLTAKLALGADLTGDAGHFGGEAVQLVDHRVDRVLHFQNLAADVGGDLFGEVAAG